MIIEGLSGGTKPVAVLRRPQHRTDLSAWLVCCGVCKPGLAPILPQVCAHQMVAHAADWKLAIEWAMNHAKEHDYTRCPSCGAISPDDARAARKALAS